MKRYAFNKAGLVVIFAAILAFMVWAGIFGSPVSASAETVAYTSGGDYGYEIISFHVEADVSPDRVVSFRETITATFSGYDSHGIIRDFPLGGGMRYRNIQASCDHSDFSPYMENEDGFLSYYLRGKSLVRGQTRTYTVTYDLICPALKEEGYFPLDLLGFGWQARIGEFTAVVRVPEGLNVYKIYSGGNGTENNDAGITVTRENNVLTVRGENLLQRYFDDYGNVSAPGITLDMSFSAGVLTTSFDFSVLWVLLLGGIVVLVAVTVKLLRCRQPHLIKPVGISAPDKMDPLLMGKLIDNSVDGEDMGALVFYLASEGYLTIDFSENKDDPTLYRSEKKLARDLPEHVKVFYKGLFDGRESVKVSDLTDRFYKTSEQVKILVNAKAAKMYDKKKAGGMTGLIAVLALLLLGGFSVLYPLFFVGAGYLYIVMAIGCIFPFVLSYGGVNLAMQRYFKWKKPYIVLICIAGVLAGSLLGLFCMVFDCAAFGFATKLMLVLFSAAAGAVSGTFLVRTKEYNEQLGEILGFKEFIRATEKHKIAFMLKEQPDLYYHVLPYAQVLGITDAWTDKFDGLDMAPPAYVHYSAGDVLFNCMVFHSFSRGFSRSFGRAAVSRPSSSGGKSGGFGGGFGGGHGGGGFGGGGGRGC